MHVFVLLYSCNFEQMGQPLRTAFESLGAFSSSKQTLLWICVTALHTSSLTHSAEEENESGVCVRLSRAQTTRLCRRHSPPPGNLTFVLTVDAAPAQTADERIGRVSSYSFGLVAAKTLGERASWQGRQALMGRRALWSQSRRTLDPISASCA
jgi:hypothetical protein